MTPEREAEIREILSGNASPAHVRVESAAYDLLAALDAERARVAEWTAEARERDAEVARWQSEARDLGRRLTAAKSALADVRQRCDGYRDSRVDGDGGIVAVVVRERDDARRSIACARYCLENDHGEAAVRACLDGMGMGPGIAEEYQSDLDRVTLERDEAQSALVGLREAGRKVLRVLDKLDVDERAAFDDALAATPAALAGLGAPPAAAVSHWLRAIFANEAERAK